MSHLLPRFTRSLEAMADQQRIARVILEAGPAEQPTTVSRATLAGDTRRLRGIPVCTRGVSGVSPGTDPLTCVIRERVLSS